MKKINKRKSEINKSPTFLPQADSDYLDFLKTYEPIIDKFCEVTTRKVSIIDEYGEENWALLDSEKQRCFVKIVNKLDISDKFMDKLFLEIEQFELQGIGKNYLISYMGQNLRFALAQINQKYVGYSFFLNKLYFYDLDEIFKKRYPLLKRELGEKEDYDGLSGIDFESLLQQQLSVEGFTVTGTPITGDQGADIIAEKKGKKFVIQAKKYTGLVGNKAVQEVVAAKNYYLGDFAVVVTNSNFTPAAKDLAQKNKVILIDSNSLTKLPSILDENS